MAIEVEAIGDSHSAKSKPGKARPQKGQRADADRRARQNERLALGLRDSALKVIELRSCLDDQSVTMCEAAT